MMIEAQAGQWYHRLSVQEQHALDGFSSWLDPLPWQLFATLNIPTPIAEETARRKVHEFIRGLETKLRCPVSCVWSLEGQTKYGTEWPWHVHMAVSADYEIPDDHMRQAWAETVGHLEYSDVHATSWVSGIHGIAYILKAQFERCEWGLHRLDHLLPESGWAKNSSHAALRGKRRREKRRAIAAAQGE